MARPTPWKPGPYLLNPGPNNTVVATPVQPATPTPVTLSPLPPNQQFVVPILYVRKKPAHARNVGQRWSNAEQQLVRDAFKTAGLAAAYNAAAHRSRPAVRGFLQRAGLVPPRFQKPVFTP